MPRKTAFLVALQLALGFGQVLAQPAEAVRTASQIPAWLQSRIAAYNAHPSDAEATAIWKVKYQGQDAYLFIAPCCDQFNPLFSSAGVRLCAPSGGIAGSGDRKCPGALQAGSERSLIWSHPGSAKK